MEKLACGGIEIRCLPSGMNVPVGGKSILVPERCDCFVEVDSENLGGFFDAMDAIFASFDLVQVGSWLKQCNATISADVFAQCAAFTRSLAAQYRVDASTAERRNEMFRANSVHKLSALLEAGVAHCAEVALLGTLSLQRAGKEARYFGGAMAEAKDFGTAPHSWIMLEEPLIFDAAVPLQGQKLLPRILQVPATFAAEVRRGPVRLLRGVEILTRDEKQGGYYGVGVGLLPMTGDFID